MVGQKKLHQWDLAPAEARALQKSLSRQVRLTPLEGPVETVGGADVSFDKGSNRVYAGMVVLRLPDFRVVEQATHVMDVDFPYVPGLLSFREAPPLLGAWGKLQERPDVLVMDGHGIAHPRRLGIAAHFGLWVDGPVMGCAKKVLTGTYQAPGENPHEWTYLREGAEIIGMVYRTRYNVKPVFLSPGHRMLLEDCRSVIKQCAGKYRIPEPTRQAHLLVNRLRRGEV